MLDHENMVDGGLHRADVVLEGGGIRAIAHVGALCAAEARGYRWQHCAGTSAGALLAALVAAGYTAGELRTLLARVDFARFARDPGWRGWPAVQFARLLTRGGLHTGDALEDFLRTHLRAKGKVTFGDLVCADQQHAPQTSRFRYRLVVMAADITNGRLLRLPQDLAAYGQNPDDLDIALAVRMSAGIPFFYRPIVCRDRTGRRYRVVDGGLLSNFPIDTFDVASAPAYPTLGIRLVDGPSPPPARASLFRFSKDLLATMLSAHDRLYLADHAYVRTISIPVHGINGMQFDLSPTQIERLYRSGECAAERFFAGWNFSAYRTVYRTGERPEGRHTLLHASMCAAHERLVAGQDVV